MNTRAIRNEKILPDVKKIRKEVNGKKVPLTPEEQYQAICTEFNEFFKQHLNYGGQFDFFYGLRDDFFTSEMCKRILTYGDIFYKDLIKKLQTGERKVITTLEMDTKRLEKFNKVLEKQLKKKAKEAGLELRKIRKHSNNIVGALAKTNANYTKQNNEGLLTSID